MSKEYKYICNNSGCPIRVSGCPIEPKDMNPERCFSCGHPMIKLPTCSKCGKLAKGTGSEYCWHCGAEMKEVVKLEPKTTITVLDN